MRQVVVALVMTSVATGVSAQGSKPPTFGVATELVSVTANVTDGQGEYVGNLTRDDFVILEDGIPQRIDFFEPQNTPLDLILLIDTSASMTTSTPMGTALNAAKESAKTFVRSLRPDDKVMVAPFSTGLHPHRDPNTGTFFTNDIPFLESSIDSLTADGSTFLYNSLYDALSKKYLPNYDSQHPRRTVIVLLSDGEDVGSLVDEEYVIEKAKNSRAPIYTIEMPHLDPSSEAQQRINYAHSFMCRLARETGGSTHTLRTVTDLSGVYTLISRELQTQYRLGYQSSSKRSDGTWRVISVHSAKRMGLSISHREGYFPSKPRHQ